MKYVYSKFKKQTPAVPLQTPAVPLQYTRDMLKHSKNINV